MVKSDNIVHGPTAEYFQESYGKLLYSSLQNGGSKIAMVDAKSDESATYEEILQRSVSLAQHLTEFGLTENDCISISSENNIYFTIPTVSALFLGITVAPINQSYTPREKVHALNISKPKIIFCALQVLDKILEATKQIEYNPRIIVFCSNVEKLPENVSSIEEYIKLPLPDNFQVTKISIDHTAAILCSSGTTGLPKGVMQTHRNFNVAHSSLIHKDFEILDSNKVGLALLPYFHTYGFLMHLAMIVEHMKMVILPKFEEELFLNAIEKYRISFACLVPPLIIFLTKSPLVDNYDLSSLKDLVCGAAPLGKEIQDAAIKRLNLNNIRQAYGLTETTLAVAIQPINIHKSGTVGKLVVGIEAKIIDDKTNEALGPNEPGHLFVRGASVMKGYYGNDEATLTAIDNDGWFNTGDVAYYDETGLFYIVDRFKELIKYKGYQVAPAEIESLLLKHDAIKDCAVIGKPDFAAGEIPLAFVAKQSNATITEKDIIEYISDKVSYQKRLRGGVKFVDSIPKSSNGKILRRILREQLKEL